MSDLADAFDLDKPLDEMSPNVRALAISVRQLVKRVVVNRISEDDVDFSPPEETP